MKVKLIYSAFCSLLLGQSIIAQNIISGPMPCHSAMREVSIWLQLDTIAELKVKYWPQNNPKDFHFSQVVKTNYSSAHTALLIADSLEPSTKYNYQIWVNQNPVTVIDSLFFKSQTLWQYRSDPPELKLIAGSCAYINEEQYDRPGSPYGGNYEIFSHMTNEKADAMLWLGDNIYLRESDWDSRSGIYKRYTHTRLQPELQAFLRSTHHYAIWDDHDYGPNDADRSYNGKYWTREAFKHFWGNPSYGENNEGTYTQFTLSDCHFFMLDNRWWRSPNKRKTGTREILGEQQLNWLIDALKNSQASFKFVCIGGQVLNTAAVYENYAGYTNERDKLLQLLDEEEIKNVIFLTGDRHHSEISSLKLKNIQVFDITSSPLTSKAYNAEKEDNKNRIKGTLTGVRNYTTLNIKGSRKNRVLNIENKDSNGKILWTYEIQSIK